MKQIMFMLLLLTILFISVQTGFAADTELEDIQWGISKKETATIIEGEIIGETLVINGYWKSFPVTFECRFTDDRLFALNIFPREKKDADDYYDDFLNIIPQLTQLYGKPIFDDEQQITEAKWVSDHSIFLLKFRTVWRLYVKEKPKKEETHQ